MFNDDDTPQRILKREEEVEKVAREDRKDESRRCCANCRFSVGYTDAFIECHRYPPKMSVIDVLSDVAERNAPGIRFGRSPEEAFNYSELRWDFPVVMWYQWCGEFQHFHQSPPGEPNHPGLDQETK